MRRTTQRALRALWLVAMAATAIGIGVAIEGWLGWPGPETWTTTVRGAEVTFLAPSAFWGAVLLPLVPALASVSLTGFSWLQRGINVALRCALVALLLIAAARPSLTRYDHAICTVYLVDVSASVPDAMLSDVPEAIAPSWSARGTNVARLVTFAERPRLVPSVPGQVALPPIARHAPEESLASNPAAALRLAYGLCPQDHIKRAVLVTDGNENRGDLRGEAATARDFGVEVSVLEVPFVAEPEVLVRRLEFPDRVSLSTPFTITAEIYATEATSARFSLQQNEFFDIQGRSLELEAGVNRVELSAEVYEPGTRDFTFRLQADGDDRFAENNTFVRTIEVAGRPQVLYVEGQARSRTYLQRALDRNRNDLANFDLDVRTAYGMPNTLEEMANFDLILLSDVDARYVSRSTMGNLERYVRELGGSLVLAGGERSFGPGGFDNTRLEEIAPVTFDMQRQRNQPSLAMMIVIDRSGSMDGLKMEMAKDAAKAVVDMLGPQDAIGVVAFDTQAQTVVRLQPATNRARIRADIGRIAAGGGTDILPALTEAYIELSGRPARLKHVIVLTDGAAPWDGLADLTSAMRAEGMTVSTVAVGADADRSLLEMIADLGGGRFHQTNDPNNIPQIFVQETSTVARTNLVEEPFRPVVTGRSQALRGIDWSNVPFLLGYVQTRAKPRARVLLETETGDPLLARWRLGLGHVAVWTSDVKNRWAVEWVRRRVYPQFWAQFIRDLMRIDTEEELALDAQIEDGHAVLRIDAIDGEDRFVNGLDSQVTLRGPGGLVVEAELEQIAAGRYEARADLPEYGNYNIEAEHTLDGAGFAVSFASLTYPYADEYLAFEPNRLLGRFVAETTGGSVDPSPATLWDPRDELRELREEWWSRVLFLALLVFVLDVMLRRVRFFGARPIAWARVVAGRAS